MKSSLNNLITLISRMDKGEKRYFKLYASIHKKDSTLIRLFHNIEKRKENEEKVRHLHVRRNQLIRLILKSMRAYRSGMNAGMRLKEMMMDAEFFTEKGVFAQASELISDAERLGSRYEKIPALMETMDAKIRVSVFRIADPETLRLYLSGGYRKELHVWEQYRDFLSYRKLALEVYSIIHPGQIRSRGELKKLDHIMHHPLLKKENTSALFQSRYYFYYAWGVYARQKNDPAKSYFYRKKMVELMERHPMQAGEHPADYLAAVSNLLVSVWENRKLNDFQIILEKILSVPCDSRDMEIRIFVFYNQFRLAFFSITGDFAGGVETVSTMEDKIAAFETQIDRTDRITLYLTIVNVFFGARDFTNALAWLNRIMQADEQEARTDIYCIARILHLIVHYELGNEDILEYLVRSTYRFLLKRKKLYKLETIVLKFIQSRLAHPLSEQGMKEAFGKLRLNLLPLSRDSFERKALQYFDFLNWVESKIEHKPFAEKIREKAAEDRR